MASGPSSSIPSSSRNTTSGTTSFEGNPECYPCCRFTVLPMFPVAHIRNLTWVPRASPVTKRKDHDVLGIHTINHAVWGVLDFSV